MALLYRFILAVLWSYEHFINNFDSAETPFFCRFRAYGLLQATALES